MPNTEKRVSAQILKEIVRIFWSTIPFGTIGVDLRAVVKDIQRSRGELGEKVERAAAALVDASILVSELEDELTTRVAKVDRLKTEYERYQQLATVEEGKAQALIEQLQLTLGAGRSRERWIALGMNLAAGVVVFVLGVWLSPWVKDLLGVGG